MTTLRVEIPPNPNAGPEASDLETFGHTYEVGDERAQAILALLEHTGTGAAAALHSLAILPAADYERVRKAEAKRLEMRAAVLDREVAKLRPATIDADDDGILTPEPGPWPEAVHGPAILTDVATAFVRYVVLDDVQADTLALWTAHAHLVNNFMQTPRLNVTSPEKGCGKTLLLDVLGTMVPRALRTENVTTAVLFRIIDQAQPTLLIDECDSFLKDADELRGALNAGHKRGGVHLRCEGDANAVRSFKTFAAVALAGIRELPDTLRDRSIVIRLARAKRDEVRERFDSRRVEHETTLKRKLSRWAADNSQSLADLDPQLPVEAYNRIADNWRPMFAVAELAGEDWPARARRAFYAVHDVVDAESVGSQLLADLRGLFKDPETGETLRERLLSAEIVEALVVMEHRPWPEWGKSKKPFTQRQLAVLLARFAIRPSTMRVKLDSGEIMPDPDESGSSEATTKEKRAKGYSLDQFKDVFERYLPSHPCQRDTVEETSANSTSGSVTPQSPHPCQRDSAEKNSADSISGTAELPPDVTDRSVTRTGVTDSVTDQTSSKPLKTRACHGVTDETAPPGGQQRCWCGCTALWRLRADVGPWHCCNCQPYDPSLGSLIEFIEVSA